MTGEENFWVGRPQNTLVRRLGDKQPLRVAYRIRYPELCQMRNVATSAEVDACDSFSGDGIETQRKRYLIIIPLPRLLVLGRSCSLWSNTDS